MMASAGRFQYDGKNTFQYIHKTRGGQRKTGLEIPWHFYKLLHYENRRHSRERRDFGRV